MRVICAVCGKPWSIKDCHDFTVLEKYNTVMPLADFVGMSVREVRDHLSAHTDALYTTSATFDSLISG